MCPREPVEELVLGLARWNLPVAPAVGALYQEGQRLRTGAKDPAGALLRYQEALIAAAEDWRGLYLGAYLDILFKIGCCHRDLGDLASAVKVFEVRQTILSGDLAGARGNPWWPGGLSLVLASECRVANPTPSQLRDAVLSELPAVLIAANTADLASFYWQQRRFDDASALFRKSFDAFLAAGLPDRARAELRSYGVLALRDGRRDDLRDAGLRLRQCRLPLSPEDLELIEASGLPRRRGRFPRFLERLTCPHRGDRP